jgi:hypothetical protein
VPPEYNNIAKLNEHFSKFGLLNNIQVCHLVSRLKFVYDLVQLFMLGDMFSQVFIILLVTISQVEFAFDNKANPSYTKTCNVCMCSLQCVGCNQLIDQSKTPEPSRLASKNKPNVRPASPAWLRQYLQGSIRRQGALEYKGGKVRKIRYFPHCYTNLFDNCLDSLVLGMF